MSVPLPWASRVLGFHIVADPGTSERSLTQLVYPGLRRNPRRAHLLVSTVLGKHIPADPQVIIGTAELLAAKAARVAGQPADVFAMAETATGLGGCVAASLHAPIYIHTTRRTSSSPSYVEFEEGHSHATHHSVQPCPANLLNSQRPLVIVDDETSTGATTLAAIAELHNRNPRPHYIMASLVDMRTEEHMAAAHQLADRLNTRIDAVSLATGHVDLPPGLIDTVRDLPADTLNITARRGTGTRARLHHSWPAHLPEGARHGFLATDTPTFRDATSGLAKAILTALDPRRPTLVIGHEEFMYLPLMVANSLAGHGLSVKFQSTTRSPAYVRDVDGYPLRRGYQFTACERDQHGPRFLYNGWPTDAHTTPTQYVLIVDRDADTSHLSGSGGIEEILTNAGFDLLTVVVDGADSTALTAARESL